MTSKEIKDLVDKGRQLKELIDSKEVELDKIKKKLKAEAKTKKADHFLGNKHFARISPQTATIIDTEEAYQVFCDMDMESTFWECCKMLVTDTKAAIGETQLASVSETKSVPYQKISFLMKPPKKYLE